MVEYYYHSSLVYIGIHIALAYVISFIEAYDIDVGINPSKESKRNTSAVVWIISTFTGLVLAVYHNEPLNALILPLSGMSFYWFVFDLSLNLRTGKDAFYTSYKTGNKNTVWTDRFFNQYFGYLAEEIQLLVKLILIVVFSLILFL